MALSHLIFRICQYHLHVAYKPECRSLHRLDILLTESQGTDRYALSWMVSMLTKA